APERGRSTVRSGLENTRAPGITTTPPEHSQPLRAGTSRAPERGRSPVRSSFENTRAPGITTTPPEHFQPLRAGTSRAPERGCPPHHLFLFRFGLNSSNCGFLKT